MKKILLVVFICMTLILSACMPDEGSESLQSEPLSSVESSEESKPDYKFMYNSLKDDYDALALENFYNKTEAKKLQTELDKEKEELRSIMSEFEQLENDYFILKNNYGRIATKTIPLDEAVYIKYVLKDIKTSGSVASASTTNLISQCFNDDRSDITIIEGKLSSVELSPDATKIIMNKDFEWEHRGTVYMYDMLKRELDKVDLSLLPESATPAFLNWLDDRYFLFVVQETKALESQGGGEFYVYDTLSGTYFPIIKSTDQTLLLYRFERTPDGILFYGNKVFGAEFPMFEEFNTVFTLKEVYNAINTKKAIILESK